MEAKDRYPFGDGSEYPLYLTTGCCEPTHSYIEDIFADRGIPAGSFDGSFYPLTDAESRYIGDHMVDVADGFGALTGYAALYQGKKYLMPSIELFYGQGSDFSSEQLLDFGKKLMAEYRNAIDSINGHLFLDEEDAGDRHTLKVLIPIEYAIANANDFDEWSAHLVGTLLKTDLKIVSSPTLAP